MLTSPNPYDIDLVRIYYLAKYQVDFINIPIKEKTRYKNSLLRDIKQYCRLNSFNFKLHLFGPQPLIITSDNNLYPKFLPLALLHVDLDKIHIFLNHQARNHKGSHIIPKEGFLEYVEKVAYKEVRRLSLVDTGFRLSKIRAWIAENRSKKPDEKRLLWQHPDKYNLGKFSKKLYDLGFTEHPRDFERIFTENKKTKWLKNPYELAYLFYLLKSKEIIKPLCTRGYLKHLEYIFCHLDILKTDAYGFNGILCKMKGRYEDVKSNMGNLIAPLLAEPAERTKTPFVEKNVIKVKRNFMEDYPYK